MDCMSVRRWREGVQRKEKREKEKSMGRKGDRDGEEMEIKREEHLKRQSKKAIEGNGEKRDRRRRSRAGVGR